MLAACVLAASVQPPRTTKIVFLVFVILVFCFYIGKNGFVKTTPYSPPAYSPPACVLALCHAPLEEAGFQVFRMGIATGRPLQKL